MRSWELIGYINMVMEGNGRLTIRGFCVRILKPKRKQTSHEVRKDNIK